MPFLSRLKQWDLWILLAGSLSSWLYALNQRIVVDSVQILERAHLFSLGELVPFGPRSSQTNFIWGSLVSAYNGFWLWVYHSHLSALIGIFLLHLAAYALIRRLPLFRENKYWLTLFLLFFWASPWRASEVFIWNPAFLLPLAVFFWWGLELNRQGSPFRGTLVAGIAIALALQIHNSALFLVFLFTFLWWKKHIRMSWGAVFLSVCILALMLAPTYYILQRNPEILSQNRGDVKLFGNLLQGGEAFKGLTYWLRYPSFYFGATTFQYPKFKWEEAQLLDILWMSLKWIFAGTSMLVVLLCNWKFFREEKDSWVKDLALFAFASLALVSIMSPVPFNFWHLYLIFPFALLPVTRVLSQRQLPSLFFIVVLVYGCLFSYVSSRKSYKHDALHDQRLNFEKKITQRSERIREKFKDMKISF